MATQDSAGFLEQHVEKLVLLVCAAVLVFGIVHWVLGTPREIEVLTARGTTNEVPPGEVDDQIVEAAEQIWDRHQRASAEVAPVFPGPQHFQRLASTPFAPKLAGDLIYFARGQLPMDTPGRVTVEPISVAQVGDSIPAPDAPVMWLGQELRRVPEGALTDENVAHGAVDFPWETLTNNWQTLLRPRGLEDRPVILRQEVQRQEVRPDGSYGPAETIRTIRGPGPEGAVAAVPELPEYNGQNSEAISQTINLIHEEYQLTALRPRFWEIWWGGTNQWVTWRRHLPQTQAIEAYAKLVAVPEPEDDAGPGPIREDEEDRREDRGRRRDTSLREDTGRRTYGPRVEEDRGRRRNYTEDRRDYGEDRGYTEDRGRRSPPPRRPREDEEDRRVTRRTRTDDTEAPTSGAAPPPVTPVPPLTRTLEARRVGWFHDIGLELGTRYRYRVRMVFVNPLYGKQIPSVVKSSEAMRQKEVASPWSDWSDVKRVPHPTEFFLTGYDSTTGMVQVTVFTRHMGRFIRQRFNVGKGQAIGGTREMRVPVPTLEGQTSRELREVDFRTAAVALDVDFNRKVPSFGNITRTTVALLYLNGQGDVQTRTRARDQESKRFRELDSLAP